MKGKERIRIYSCPLFFRHIRCRKFSCDFNVEKSASMQLRESGAMEDSKEGD